MVTIANHISHDTDVGKYMACFFRMSHTHGIHLGIQKSYEQCPSIRLARTSFTSLGRRGSPCGKRS
jgi:hypothetical protein